MNKIEKFFVNSLVHVEGSKAAHIVDALETAGKIATLSPGQSEAKQVAQINEFGAEFEVWFTVRRSK